MRIASFILVLCMAFVQSCTTQIHYVQLFKTQPTNSVAVGNFYVYENDTLRIVYYFWQEDGIMAFSVYNKSDKPLYIDWKKSSFITNSSKSNYWDDKTIIKGAWGASSAAYSETVSKLSSYSQIASLQQSRIDETGAIKTEGQANIKTNESAASIGTTLSTTQGWSHISVSKQERITFIPPRSYINNTIIYNIKTDYYKDWKSGYTQTKEALSSDPKTITTISSKTFTKGNSPLDFRNFMTFSLKEDFSTEFYADNEFYIKEVVSMDQRQFYLYKFDKTTNTVSPKIMSKYMNGIDFYVK